MHKQLPKPAFPKVAEIIEASPGVRLNGNVETAWKLIADLSGQNGTDVLVLAVAVGLLCRELSGREPDQPRLSLVTKEEL